MSDEKRKTSKQIFKTKIRQELLDQDYVHKLNDKEREWLERFNKEFVAGSFEKAGKKYSSKNLHKGKEKRKELYRENNKRKIDAHGVAKAMNTLIPIKDSSNTTNNNNYIEDAMIDMIDGKNYVNALKDQSVRKLADSERKHNQLAKLRKNFHNKIKKQNK